MPKGKKSKNSSPHTLGCRNLRQGIQFSDKLILVLGLNASNLFQLATETATFRATPNFMIYWRLESKDDMAGSAVTINIEKSVNGSYTAVQSIPYPDPQSYGHIVLSSLPWTQTGSFRATDILTAETKTVAACDLTAK